MPLIREFKHGKIYFPKEGNRDITKLIDILPKYPNGCNDEEKYHVQSFARNMMDASLMGLERYKLREWPKYFWRHNFDIVPCKPAHINFKKGGFLSKADAESLYNLLEDNVQVAINYLNEVSIKHKYDLYNPEKDEIILGLFSRITRFFVLILQNPDFWARDIAGIMLRCLTDSAITFGYLVKAGTEKDFEDFKSYAEGKEKLLMLHLQDTYPDKKSLEGLNSEDIAEGLGGFTVELIDIELGNWTKKSARDLAIKAELEEFYRLIYDPASSDVHGTWTSIKKSSLVRCNQPLHRFHRVPQFYEPPLFVNMMIAAQRIYFKCIELGISNLQFPVMNNHLKDVASFSQGNKTEENGQK